MKLIFYFGSLKKLIVVYLRNVFRDFVSNEKSTSPINHPNAAWFFFTVKVKLMV